MNRRDFLKTAFVGIAGISLLPKKSPAQPPRYVPGRCPMCDAGSPAIPSKQIGWYISGFDTVVINDYPLMRLNLTS
jgi:hypothetical protein